MPEQIRVVDIEPNPNNPRKNFDPGKLGRLAESIKEHGIIQALVVTPLPVGEGEFPRYRLICGERRLRAAKVLGLATVPTDIQDTLLLPAVEAERMLIENLQREDLDPIEEALGQKLGVSQGHIANRLRLLELPEPVRENISRGIISSSHGKVLAGHRALPEVVLRKAAKSIADNAVPVSRAATEVYKAIAEHGRDLREYMAKFDMAGCEGCQHVALGSKYGYNGTTPEERYCLKHSCYDKKQAEAEAAREAKIAKKAERMLKKGQQAVDLAKLGHGNFEQINPYGRTEIDATECKDCEHLALGKSSYSDDFQEVCIKPSCYRKKKAALARDEGKAARDALKEEFNQAAILAGLKAASLKRWEAGHGNQVDSMFVVDRPTLIYLTAMVLGNVDPWGDRKVTLYRYLKDKHGWESDLFKRGAWGLTHHEWSDFLRMLETLSDQQLLDLIFEWPAIAQGLGGAAGWILQQGPSQTQEPEPAEPRVYLDEKGRELFVSTGLGSEFGTFWQSEKGGLHRVKSPAMPMVATREVAQANLDAWAQKKGLQPVKLDQCKSA